MRTLAFLALAALPASLWAAAQALTPTAGGLTLPQALKEAARNSPRLKGMEAAADASSWSRLEALSGALPRVDLSAQQVLAARYTYMGVHFGGSAVSFPGAYPESVLTASVNWRIFDGLSTWRRMASAGLDAEAADLALTRARQALRAGVTRAYDEALAARQLAVVARRDVETLQAHLQVAQDNLDAGMGVKLDVLRIQARLEEAQAEAQAAQDHADTARRDLATAMGLARDGRSLEGSLPVPDPAALRGLPELDEARRPDLEAARARVKALKAAREAVSGGWLPSVSLYADDQFYHDTDRFDSVVVASDGYQTAYSGGVRLDWNLLDGGATLARRKMAEDREEEARQKARALALSLPSQVADLKAAYASAVSLYQARTRAVEKSQENVRLSRLGLTAGTRTHSEVLDAEQDLFRARAGLVRAQADAAEALASLREALGTAP